MYVNSVMLSRLTHCLDMSSNYMYEATHISYCSNCNTNDLSV